MNEQLVKELVKKAMDMTKLSYAPYSGYHVGASLLAKNGQIYTGCNIENASYGATNCAERTAFFKAVSDGVKEFEAIAIVGAPADAAAQDTFSEYAYPCGICRQVMQEFCKKDFVIIVAKSTEDCQKYTLQELLPFGFGGID